MRSVNWCVAILMIINIESISASDNSGLLGSLASCFGQYTGMGKLLEGYVVVPESRSLKSVANSVSDQPSEPGKHPLQQRVHFSLESVRAGQSAAPARAATSMPVAQAWADYSSSEDEWDDQGRGPKTPCGRVPPTPGSRAARARAQQLGQGHESKEAELAQDGLAKAEVSSSSESDSDYQEMTDDEAEAQKQTLRRAKLMLSTKPRTWLKCHAPKHRDYIFSVNRADISDIEFEWQNLIVSDKEILIQKMSEVGQQTRNKLPFLRNKKYANCDLIDTCVSLYQLRLTRLKIEEQTRD